MASHTVATGSIASHDNVLVASSVDTVTFTDDALEVQILTDGTSKVYVTVDGSTPTVSGAHCHLIPAVIAPVILRPPNSAAVTVKLISSGTPTYSVTSTLGTL